jgi:hypothetical protein
VQPVPSGGFEAVGLQSVPFVDPFRREARVAVAAPPITRDSSRIARLRAVVDEYAALDPDELSDPELAGEMLAFRREMDRQDAAFARMAHTGHRRGIGSTDGAASTAAWLRGRAGMREGDAKAAIECGEVSALLAETGAAWRAGEITTGEARTIAAARVRGFDTELAACEPDLLALARRHDLRTLRRATAHFRHLATADGSEPGARDGLFVSQLYDGRTVISGEVGDLAAETIVTALHAYTDPPSDDDHRTTPQRTAAALERIAEVALAHHDDPKFRRVRKQVSVVIDWKTLVDGAPGRLDGEFTGPIHPQDIELLLCDCSVSRVVTGPDSLPIDVGRTRRIVPPPLRRALVTRDQGCRWPTCNRPAAWCDGHHVVPWTEEGPTDLDNCVLFCRQHHRTAHQPGWRVEFDGRVLRVYRPDGTELT